MDPQNKLAGVHQDLLVKVQKILAAMEALGFPMMVTDGFRSVEEQQQLFAKGRTIPGENVSPTNPMGDTVTNADGVKDKSNHQAHDDGLGHAVDCCFIVKGKPSWQLYLPWNLYGVMAKTLGLNWGGDWVHRPDRPHIELP